MQENFFSMISFFQHWKKTVFFLFSSFHFLVLFVAGFCFLILSLWLSHLISYQNDFLVESTPVGDFLHNMLPLWDLSFFFIIGAFFILATGIFYFVFFEPQHLPFAFMVYGFFFLVRGICISLTHIGIPPDHIPPIIGNLGNYFFENDLFFSGHTGVPFLAALLLWKQKK